jgi:hypothetical protein
MRDYLTNLLLNTYGKKTNIRYSVTIHIDLIQNRLNSLGHKEYHNYLEITTLQDSSLRVGENSRLW